MFSNVHSELNFIEILNVNDEKHNQFEIYVFLCYLCNRKQKTNEIFF